MRLALSGRPFAALLPILFSLVVFTAAEAPAQDLNGWDLAPPMEPGRDAVVTPGQFNGYTRYWSNDYWNWYSYGNLFRISLPAPEKQVIQNKLDIAEELALTGFLMEEGFLSALLADPPRTLDNPSAADLDKVLGRENVLVYVESSSPLGKSLEAKLPSHEGLRERMKSNQYQSESYKSSWAFYLEKGDWKLFVVSSECPVCLKKIKGLIGDVQDLMKRYDLHRGWPGAKTMFYSVTSWPGHPLEIIGKGMNQGNDWISFNGYMDYLLQKDLGGWLEKVKLPIVWDVGSDRTFNIYRLSDWDGFTPQDFPTPEAWLDYTRSKGGLAFRPVFDPSLDNQRLDGQAGGLGNKEQMDTEEVPFIIDTGFIKENAPPCMVLFVDKGAQLTRELMYGAILDRRNVAVMEMGQMMGPALYRRALQMLLLDRVYLEEYFGDRVNVEADVRGRELIVTIKNTYPRPLSGTITVTLPPELEVEVGGGLSKSISLPAGSNRTESFVLKPTAAAMGRDNPVAVNFAWDEREKGTLTVMQLPPAVSVQRLLYGHEPEVIFPVSVHNFGDRKEFPVKVEVLSAEGRGRKVFNTSATCSAAPGEYAEIALKLKVKAGRYNVKVSALGIEAESQLGVGKKTGKPYLYATDLNGDGVDEYRMENDKVQVTLLAVGARVIEYIVKERNDNVLFKLWPEKEASYRRPFRMRQFYPYGGFEDFLGQPSVETHKLYDAEIIKKEGDFVRLKMTADYYGNKLTKIFTLYGDTPLLEIRFALDFEDPESNMIGPQPILALGEKHWTEDVFVVPTRNGREEYRMRPEENYGRVFDIKEGWNAGYDSKEDITFIGAYPVDQPEFLHMWQNTPSNQASFHYYSEFQPWIRIIQKNTMYFSYYLWGAAGPWEDALKVMEGMGLISKR